MSNEESAGLPIFEAWRDGFGGGVGLWDYAAQKGGATLALAFASLFWPRLIDVDGCVFLAERYDPDAHRQWLESLSERPEALERTMNHVHLWDLFDPASEGIAAKELDRLAEVIAQTWRAALVDQFPNRGGDVEIANDDESYGPTLTLFTTHA